jgi:hypothetical protein
MSAVPASPMMVRTSAKSTLIRPGRMIISLMPTTPVCRKVEEVECVGAVGREQTQAVLGCYDQVTQLELV